MYRQNTVKAYIVRNFDQAFSLLLKTKQLDVSPWIISPDSVGETLGLPYFHQMLELAQSKADHLPGKVTIDCGKCYGHISLALTLGFKYFYLNAPENIIQSWQKTFEEYKAIFDTMPQEIIDLNCSNNQNIFT